MAKSPDIKLIPGRCKGLWYCSNCDQGYSAPGECARCLDRRNRAANWRNQFMPRDFDRFDEVDLAASVVFEIMHEHLKSDERFKKVCADGTLSDPVLSFEFDKFIFSVKLVDITRYKGHH